MVLSAVVLQDTAAVVEVTKAERAVRVAIRALSLGAIVSFFVK